MEDRRHIEDFISYLDCTKATANTYRNGLIQWYDYLEENGIQHPGRENVISYREQLKVSHKPTTTQNYIEILKLFYSWTESEGIYENITRGVKGCKLTTDHKKDYLQPDQVREVLSIIDNTRDKAIFLLMVLCGLRCEEIRRANIEDLTTQGGKLVLFIQGKGREDKTEFVRIPKELEEVLYHFLKERKPYHQGEPLFTSQSSHGKGERLTTRSISRIIKGYLVRAGYDSERLTAHSLRHTAVTLALKSGSDIQQAQAFARHKNITTTQIYAHNIDRESLTCETDIARLIF